MESRKYQLQKQIVEALKANDNDLYSLLKSQWAHRFGVESLEELKNLDLSEVNLNINKEDNQKKDQTKVYFGELDKAKSIRSDDNPVKEITNDNEKLVESVELENKESFEIKSEIVDKEKYQNNSIEQFREYKSSPKVQALIPLPPKPKYGFLKKWLL